MIDTGSSTDGVCTYGVRMLGKLEVKMEESEEKRGCFKEMVLMDKGDENWKESKERMKYKWWGRQNSDATCI